ncbi:DUF5615 family PIN-like protein [Candidatus Bathyarchaeota archaeon]|nr:DUF5615 family PIN-like protein [Candidatus Brockarchaeota archaeon]MBS7620475.1 DUF5615 family PIN-like protein [Candidatus Bathyarchaeota archaeon]
MSKLKILVDENIESSLIRFLEEKGFDVKHAPRGSRNSEPLTLAEKEDRVILTHDHDFLRLESYKPVSGTLVLPVYPITEMEEILLKFFKKFTLEKIKGKAFLLTREGFFAFKEGGEKPINLD